MLNVNNELKGKDLDGQNVSKLSSSITDIINSELESAPISGSHISSNEEMSHKTPSKKRYVEADN